MTMQPLLQTAPSAHNCSFGRLCALLRAGHLRLHITLIFNDALLPKGWTEAIDTVSNASYFYNAMTGRAQWNEPLEIAALREGIIPGSGPGTPRKGSELDLAVAATGLDGEDDDGAVDDVSGRERGGSSATDRLAAAAGHSLGDGATAGSLRHIEAGGAGGSRSTERRYGRRNTEAALLLMTAISPSAIRPASASDAEDGGDETARSTASAKAGTTTPGGGALAAISEAATGGSMDEDDDATAAAVTAATDDISAIPLSRSATAKSHGVSRGGTEEETEGGERRVVAVDAAAPAAAPAAGAGAAPTKAGKAKADDSDGEGGGGSDGEGEAGYDADKVAKTLAHMDLAGRGKKKDSDGPSSFSNPLGGGKSGYTGSTPGEARQPVATAPYCASSRHTCDHGGSLTAARMGLSERTSPHVRVPAPVFAAERMKAMAEAMAVERDAKKRAEEAALSAKLAAMSPEERAEFEAAKQREERREQRKNRMLHSQLGAYGAAGVKKPGTTGRGGRGGRGGGKR